MGNVINKTRFWVGVLYLENMIENWQEKIEELLEIPFAYCIHSKDTDSMSVHRKDHIHLILVFSNTTTKNHAMKVFDLLSAEGRKAINTCQAIINIRNKYEYLIHNTDSCKKANKHLYSPEERITGNNFDIGAYEQISLADKKKALKELCDYIQKYRFTDLSSFYEWCDKGLFNQSDIYFDVYSSYSGMLTNLCKGNFMRNEKENLSKRD